MKTETKRQSPKQQLLSDERIKTKLAASIEAQGPFLKRVEQGWPVAHPEFKRAALKVILGSDNDLDVVTAAQREYDALGTDGAKLAANRAKTLLRNALGDFAAPVAELLNAADTVIDEIIAERDAAEKSFFASWGLDDDGVDTRVAAVARDVKKQIAGERHRLFSETQGPHVHVSPSSLGSILNWFTK